MAVFTFRWINAKFFNAGIQPTRLMVTTYFSEYYVRPRQPSQMVLLQLPMCISRSNVLSYTTALNICANTLFIELTPEHMWNDSLREEFFFPIPRMFEVLIQKIGVWELTLSAFLGATFPNNSRFRNNELQRVNYIFSEILSTISWKYVNIKIFRHKVPTRIMDGNLLWVLDLHLR